MNKLEFNIRKGLVLVAASMGLVSASNAAVVYNNSINYRTNFYNQPTLEFGDQLNLAGSERLMTNFSFEYFASGLGGGETAVLNLYRNNGASGAPGTSLFSSTPFGIVNGVNTVTLDGVAITVPNTFTFTVQFSGVTGAEQAGLPIYDPPTIGSSFDDFWQKDSAGNWGLFRYAGGNPPGNFAARVIALPEVGTIYYALFGGIAFAGYHLLRRRAPRAR